MDRDEGEACACPFCDGGDIPQEVAERIKTAATEPMSKRMSLDEFLTWLDSFGRVSVTDK